jgi:molybdopterin converting factor small subunit
VRVEVRLFATLTRYRADTTSGEPFDIDLPDDATIADLLLALRVPSEEIHLTIVDGRITHADDHRLADSARVGFFPPVGGG